MKSRCPLYPPKADIQPRIRDVRFVPKADIIAAARLSLFDHLVCIDKKLFGNLKS
jgi:hypothetical protein